jgi:hypothetical protein
VLPDVFSWLELDALKDASRRASTAMSVSEGALRRQITELEVMLDTERRRSRDVNASLESALKDSAAKDVYIRWAVECKVVGVCSFWVTPCLCSQAVGAASGRIGGRSQVTPPKQDADHARAWGYAATLGGPSVSIPSCFE